jgi:hypothetical protein
LIPDGAWYTVALDPASSESKTADYFAIVVLAFYGSKVFIVDTFQSRGLDPDQAMVKLFEFIFKYSPRNIVVETVAFQKMLAWYIKKQMDAQRRYVPVLEHDDKRKKADVILQSILSVAPQGNLFYRTGQTDFAAQFCSWSPTSSLHDDLLDAISRGISAQHRDQSVLEGEYEEVYDHTPALSWQRACP